MKRTRVAIGPMTERPSWKWLGPHMAESLAESCTVRFFGDGDLPRSDAVIFVKERPRRPLRQALGHGCPILYMPVDFYQSREQLDADSLFLSRCAGLLAHSRRLGAELDRHDVAVWYVDHPNLYGLAEKPPYRADGDLLWIGDFYNLPYLLRWWQGVKLPHALRILTNPRRTSVKGMAMSLARARHLGIELDVEPHRVNGIAMHEWSPAAQRAMMWDAKAAVDIKGGEEDFHQFTKPPTKAQQLVVSGVPFATNSGSAIMEDLRDAGFEVADVGDPERWLSRAYWEETRAVVPALEERIHPRAVALAYRRCLEEVLARSPSRPGAPAVQRASAGPVHAGGPGVRDHVRAFRLLRRLNAPWQTMSPHLALRVLAALRTYVPGYAICRELGGTTATASVSVVVDPTVGDEGSSGELAAEIPAAWEVIAFRDGPFIPSGVRVKALGRWPRRGPLRDRMLACSRANGELLAFVSCLDDRAVAWIHEALGVLKEHPRVAVVRRPRDASPDSDDPASFVVRREVWRALGGYQPGRLMSFPHCSETDLFQRIENLGFAVEPPLTVERRAGSQSPIGGDMVVYTAITSRYDRLRPLDRRCVEPARQIAFLDGSTRAVVRDVGDWHVRDAAEGGLDPMRRSRAYKICPELHFPDAAYSLWIDGNVSLIYPFDLPRLIELYLTDADICVFRHHARTCLYEEAEACKLRRLDSAELIDRQMERYRRDGFPRDYGLNELTVILRRHTEAVKDFDRLWWDEICGGSRRDQLSFNYVRWKTGLPVAEFPLAIQERNGLFAKDERRRRWPPRLFVTTTLRAALSRMEGFHLMLGVD